MSTFEITHGNYLISVTCRTFKIELTVDKIFKRESVKQLLLIKRLMLLVYKKRTEKKTVKIRP